MQRCHVNLLKPYQSFHSVSEMKGDALSDNFTLVSVKSVATVGVVPSENFDIPSESVLTGKLNDFEHLTQLDFQLGYLLDTQQTDLVKLINLNRSS